MNEYIEDLLTSVISQQHELQQQAALYLAMVLEKSTRSTLIDRYNAHFRPGLEYYETILPVQLNAFTLDEADQSRLVARMASIIPSTKGNRSSLFWALGKSLPWIGLQPLLQLFPQALSEYDDETLYQALAALDNYLPSDIETLPQDIKGILSDYNPSAHLQALLSSRVYQGVQSDINSFRITDITKRLLDKLKPR